MWVCCATPRTSPSRCASPRTPSTAWSTPRDWARTAPVWPSTSNRRLPLLISNHAIFKQQNQSSNTGLDHLCSAPTLLQHNVDGCGGGDGVLQHSCCSTPPQAGHKPGARCDHGDQVMGGWGWWQWSCEEEDNNDGFQGRGYHVRCRYQSQERTLTNDFNVRYIWASCIFSVSFQGVCRKEGFSLNSRLKEDVGKSLSQPSSVFLKSILIACPFLAQFMINVFPSTLFLFEKIS